MTVTVTRLRGQPIIVATVSGRHSLQTMLEVFTRSAELITDSDPFLYRITDFTGVDSTLADVVAMAREARQGLPGSTTDSRFRPVFVGSNAWVKLGHEAMRQPQFGGVVIPIFDTMDAALAYVHDQIARQDAGSNQGMIGQ